jgi:hypothetical protein
MVGILVEISDLVVLHHSGAELAILELDLIHDRLNPDLEHVERLVILLLLLSTLLLGRLRRRWRRRRDFQLFKLAPLPVQRVGEFIWGFAEVSDGGLEIFRPSGLFHDLVSHVLNRQQESISPT